MQLMQRAVVMQTGCCNYALTDLLDTSQNCTRRAQNAMDLPGYFPQ
jgi:hypothetical protein